MSDLAFAITGGSFVVFLGLLCIGIHIRLGLENLAKALKGEAHE
jgi:hypothetical protein